MNHNEALILDSANKTAFVASQYRDSLGADIPTKENLVPVKITSFIIK